ncbi:hypothetical protein BWQ96_01972 [Gracilariopsis chorda]|uniref:Uncharacterized protein n=1 Tax=Gracilariopsis chorda TaxID=448386 RepID=A0A2V3J1T1_9FLOR|nr:hypothetical protein BWQ96_01972 [Gracilariopsis chorda]|eukprot:PXF48283.1 hypothetical protein BWQ96_01972 [Gracilariopsis chorda]
MATQVPSFYAVIKESVERIPQCKLQSLEENDHIIGLQDTNRKQTGALCKVDVPLNELVAKIREAEHSLLVDVQNCTSRSDPASLGTGVYGESLGVCKMEDIATNVAQLDPVRRGEMLIVCGTSGVRKCAQYIRIGDGQVYHICTDPSYILVGLVPGERTDVVGNVVLSGATVTDASQSPLLSVLITNVKYYLLALTDPISYDTHNLDWHSLLIAYSAVLRVRELGRTLVEGVVGLHSTEGRMLLELHFHDGALTEVNADHERGILRTFDALLFAEPTGALRTDRLVFLDGTAAGNWRAILIALVVAQVAEQAHVSGEVALKPLYYSRVVDECIGFVSEGALQAAVQTLCEGFGDFVRCEGKRVCLGTEWFDLCDASSSEDFERDHEKAGSLGVDRIDRKIRIGHITLKPGRGTPLSATSVNKSYWSRERRHVLSVHGRRFHSRVQIDISEDLFFWTKIRFFELSPDGVGGAFDPRRESEQVNDEVVNALLLGLHGPIVARWVWAKIRGVAVDVTERSRNKCYLGAGTKVSSTGHEICSTVSSKAVGQCVTYVNPETERIYIDITDRGDFPEVESKPHWYSHLSSVEPEIIRGQNEKLRECVIAGISDFCNEFHYTYGICRAKVVVQKRRNRELCSVGLYSFDIPTVYDALKVLETTRFSL